jgi:ATP-dependent Lon protease
VVYPETAVPLTIGQPRSIRLVDDVVAGEDRLIGLVASRDPDLEIPEPKDLFEIGTVAMIHRLFRAPDGTIRLLVQGTARFSWENLSSTSPILKHKSTSSLKPRRKGLKWRHWHAMRATSSRISVS